MIKFLIEKEFKQLLRNSFLPRLILVFPLYDHVADALGREYGNKEYTAEYR